MAVNREATLRKAEKLVRQGRLDAAIAEYVRVVEDQPHDWATANTLGDLYVRAGQVDQAAQQYARIADHFLQEGFFPKAGALYKKILKVKPNDETTQLHLAEVARQQGVLVDAKAYLSAVRDQRQAWGHLRGVDEMVVQLGEIDPGDLEARLTAARARVRLGDAGRAVTQLSELAADLGERGRTAEALAALRDAVQIDPSNVAIRASLARACLASGDLAGARQHLSPETTGNDPILLLAFGESELRAGHHEAAREILKRALALDPAAGGQLTELGWALCETDADASFVCLDLIADLAIAAQDWEAAAALLHEFVTRVPKRIGALLKLVEVSVDGGLEALMQLAQVQLADVYLEGGQAAEARVIAEHLVAREPWERAHIERFRQALVMLGESDPDGIVAERLSGSSPFVSTDHFATQRGEGEAELQKTGTPSGGRTGDLLPDPSGIHGEPTPARVKPEEPVRVANTPPEPPRSPHRGEGGYEVGVGALNASGPVGDAATNGPKRGKSPEIDLTAMLGDLTPAAMSDQVAGPAPAAEDRRALLYELGEGLEAQGETARALAVFLELHADAGEYRDVAARIDRLSRVRTGG